MLSLLDKFFDRLDLWTKHTLAPRAQTFKAYSAPFGLLLFLPLLLFPLAAASHAFHGWRGAMALLGLMTVTAAADGLFHGALALLLFLGLWRGRVSLSAARRPRMKLNFFFSPLLYGLIAAWGITALQGRASSFLLHLNVWAFLCWWFANLALTLSQRRKALPSA